MSNIRPVLHRHTALLESNHLSKLCSRTVYLKMENNQPSGSFKIRGLGNLIRKSVESQGVNHLISSSGGNAGMATAYAGKKYGIRVTVVVPGSTPKMIIPWMEDMGATVLIHGNIWHDAHVKALELSREEKCLYVHPYEHPLIWEGHESLLEEILEDCPDIPSAIVLSVGGGGMLCGVMQALQKRDLKIPIVAMETQGAHCFNAALKAGKPVDIGHITSLAKTLGASSVTSRVFDLLPHVNVISKVISDKLAVDACQRFANEERTLVELSCSAALVAGYNGIVADLVRDGEIIGKGPVVFVVCGGNAVTIPLIEGWKKAVEETEA